MLQHHKSHVYLNWATERMDEMNAALVALEKQVRKLTGTQSKGEELIADLKKLRDEFAAAIKKHAEAGEAIWDRVKPELESQWNSFDEKLRAYFHTIGKHAEQQLETFEDVAAAQKRAWRDAAAKLAASADKLAAGKRPAIDAAIKQMNSDAAEMDAHLNKLKHAGQQSWSALSGALDQSRRAFDKANQKAWDAFKHAAR